MESDQIFFLAIYVLFIIVVSMIAIFSLASLIVTIRYWNSHCRSILNLLTCHSCIAFLFLNMVMVIQIPYLFQANQHRQDSISDTFWTLTCLAKIFSYLIQAISRYFAIIPYRRRNLLTFRVNEWLIVSSWFLSFLLGSAMSISPVTFQYEPKSRLCVWTMKVFRTPSHPRSG